MIKIYKNEQSGRSMVEMLGVLAIIGVLSVGGIAGYSKAMTKFKINKSMDQISMLANAISFGIIPGEMDGGGSIITNAFAGNVTIGTDTVNGNAHAAFTIKYEGLGQEACVTMATSDWGSGSSSGLVDMTVSAAATGGTTYSGTDLPVSLINAAANCNCATATCSIEWTYL